MLCPKSEENWEAGRLCLEQGMTNAAASRFYYSLFRVVRHHAAKSGVLPYGRKHSKRSIHEYLVWLIGNDERGRELRPTYQALLGLRSTADYGREDVDAKQIELHLLAATDLRNYYKDKLRKIRDGRSHRDCR